LHKGKKHDKWRVGIKRNNNIGDFDTMACKNETRKDEIGTDKQKGTWADM
jgi:hypothetical protein